MDTCLSSCALHIFIFLMMSNTSVTSSALCDSLGGTGRWRRCRKCCSSLGSSGKSRCTLRCRWRRSAGARQGSAAPGVTEASPAPDNRPENRRSSETLAKTTTTTTINQPYLSHYIMSDTSYWKSVFPPPKTKYVNIWKGCVKFTLQTNLQVSFLKLCFVLLCMFNVSL